MTRDLRQWWIDDGNDVGGDAPRRPPAGKVSLTQHIPVQRRVKVDAHSSPKTSAVELYGFVQAYGGEAKPSDSAAFPDQTPVSWLSAEADRACRDAFDFEFQPIQRVANPTANADADAVHVVAARGIESPAAPLPHLDRIQESFGHHDVAHVQAHVGGPAAEASAAMGASAYATGDHIAFASAPDLHTAAHEAAHVVQQKGGVQLKGGVGEVGDAYEQHADAVADKVVAGESAEVLLDQFAGGVSASAGRGGTVQRKPPGATDPQVGSDVGGETRDDAAPAIEPKSGRKWSVFAESGKPYLIRPHEGRPGFWVVRDWIVKGPHSRHDGAFRAPGQAIEILREMGTENPDFAAGLLTFRFPRGKDVAHFAVDTTEASHALGLPPGRDAIAERGEKHGLFLTVSLDDPSIKPGTAIQLSAGELARGAQAAAAFTGLSFAPNGIANLLARWTRPVDLYAGNGVVFFKLSRAMCQQLFGADAYDVWSGAPKAKQLDTSEAKAPKLKLENFYQRPIPGELTHHADIVESGESIRFEVVVNWPGHFPDNQVFDAPPMVTPSKFGNVALLKCRWRFERVPSTVIGRVMQGAMRGASQPGSPAGGAGAGPSGDASPAPAASGGSAASAAANAGSPVSGVVGPGGAVTDAKATEIAEVMHRFALRPGESSATFRVTCDAEFDEYFAPNTFTRDVVVMASPAAVAKLQSEAFDLGAAGTDRSRGSWTADMDPGAARSPTPDAAGTLADPMAGDRQMQRERLEAVGDYLRGNPASAEAVAAIDAELVRQRRTEELLAKDRARGWQSFQIRGTYLSRTEGLASGPLDLHGTVRVEAHYDSMGGGDGPATSMRVRDDKYVVQIRDLSRRFEQNDFTFDGKADTFDDALKAAFEDLAVAYPKGVVSIEAEQIRREALRQTDGSAGPQAAQGPSTGKVIGFQRSTETTWKKVKEVVWDPVASVAVNLGAIALMTLVPVSAAVVAPALIAYNSIPAVDNIKSQMDRGTLTLGTFAMSTGEIALNLLPLVSRAKPFTAGWFAVETANWGGQVALMAGTAVDMAKDLQAKQVAALAEEYQAFLELKKKSRRSDPDLDAAEAAIRAKAEALNGEVYRQFDALVGSNLVQMVAGSVVHHKSARVRSAIVEYLSGVPRRPGSAGHAAPHPDGDAPPPDSGGDADGTGQKPGQNAPGASHQGPLHAVSAHELEARRAGWEAIGGNEHVSAVHYDPSTNKAHFDVQRNGLKIRVTADVAPRIMSAGELTSLSNRIVGQPIKSQHVGHDILRAANRGDLSALKKVGVEVPADTKLQGIEFGLGKLPDGRYVVVRGEPSAVDWSHLPGVEPVAHTHPLTSGNEPRAVGVDRIPLADIADPNTLPLAPRAIVYPSAEDIASMAIRAVKEHRVFTELVVKRGSVEAPAPDDDSPRLEWVILDAKHAGTLPGQREVYKALVVGEVGGKPVVRQEVWAIQPPPGSQKFGDLVTGDPTPQPVAAPRPPLTPEQQQRLDARRAELHSVVKNDASQLGGDVDVVVLDEQEFRERFRSEKQGRAVFVPEATGPRIYARADATAADVRTELDHNRQLQSPTMGAEIRKHHHGDLERWDELSVRDRLGHFLRKLEVEIDSAEHRMADAKTEGRSAVAAVKAELASLRDLQKRAFALSDAQVAEMSAGLREVPDYLKDPAWLFTKERKAIGRADRNNLKEDSPLTILPDAGPERSAAYTSRGGVKTVHRLGNEWNELVHVSSDVEGTATIRGVGTDSVTVIVTDKTGKERFYPLEPGAELSVKDGDPVKAGDLLATESNRRYRLVKIEFEDGRPSEMREEIRNVRGEWVQRGSESTRRGGLMEDAAKLQLDARLKEAGVNQLEAGTGTGYRRIKHQRGGGGFDDVVVIFSSPNEVVIKIQEVKDYPDKYVPYEEFTAIQGKGLRENLDVLEQMIDNAINEVDQGGRATDSSFDGMTMSQLKAIKKALMNKVIEIDVVLGPSTKLGGNEGQERSVIRKLREGVHSVLHKDVLRANTDEHRVEADYVAEAVRKEGSKP